MRVAESEGPLAGVRVLDLSRLLPGPFATGVLRDLGASVDKVEDPAGGDYLRFMPPTHEGVNPAFVALNRGKRSVVLDLKRAEGRQALSSLLGGYDVLVESFRPGVMARLGFAPDTVRAAHPRLIYCSLTGYGATGPLADRAGHDLNFLAQAGVLGLTGPAGAPPQVSGAQVADIGGGGLYAVVAILGALLERGRTGRGAWLDVAMADGTLAFGLYGTMAALAGLATPRGEDPLTGGIAPYGTYRTKDGRFVALAALEPKFWERFCAAAGLAPEMGALAPGPHQREWRRAVAERIAERTAEEWATVAAEADCCLSVVEAPEDLAHDPHFQVRGMFATTVGTNLTQLGSPLGPRRRELPAAPVQGQHSREILREAGLTDARIDELLTLGVTR